MAIAIIVLNSRNSECYAVFMTLYDVTRPVNNVTPVWPDDTPFRMEEMERIATGSSVNLTTLHLSAHTGTHADAWWHCSDEGVRIGLMPLDLYIGPAQVITLSRGSGGITIDELTGIDLTRAERVLFHTS